MTELLVLVFNLILSIVFIVGLVYLSLALQAQLRGKVTAQSDRYERRGLAYATLGELFWVLWQTSIVYTEGPTDGNLTWLLVATAGLLITGYLWWNQDK